MPVHQCAYSNLFFSSNTMVFHSLLVVTDSNIKVWEYLFTTKSGEGWVNGTAGITGVLLFVVFGVMAVMSLPTVRRKGHFEVSRFKHLVCFIRNTVFLHPF